MILVYPMLTSSEVSPSILPGICKVLEQFILLYGINDVLKLAKQGLGTKIIKVGSSLMQQESQIFEEKKKKKIITKGLVSKAGKAAGEIIKPESKDTKVFMPDHDSLSLDPSYVQIETPKSGPKILGIKVIPFPVKGKDTMVKLILDDTNRKKMEYLTTKYGRKVTRIFYRLCRSLKIPMIKNQTLTGDPRKDILFASTKYSTHIFTLFNFMDISNEKIFRDPATVQKLYNLSWGSYIFADDVNKRAIFCMKQFGGLCSVVLYSYMLASFKKGKYYDVYKDLEDIKRTSSPFFSMKVNPRKLIGENYSIIKQKEFNNLRKKSVNEQTEVITEDINSIIKSMATGNKFQKLLSNIESLSKSQNIDKIKKSLTIIPKISFLKVEQFCKKISSNFEYSYNLSKKVIANSTNIPKNLVNSLSCIIALKSSYKNDNYKQDTKTNLQNVVIGIRKIKVPIQNENIMIQELVGVSLFKYIIDLFLTTLKILISPKFSAEIQWQLLKLSALWASVPTTAIMIILAIIILIILANMVENA